MNRFRKIALSAAAVLALGGGMATYAYASPVGGSNGFDVNKVTETNWFPSSSGTIQTENIECDTVNDTLVSGGITFSSPTGAQLGDHVKILASGPTYGGGSKDAWHIAVWSDGSTNDHDYEAYAICKTDEP